MDTALTYRRIIEEARLANNCGVGSGGFQPGNTCARGGGGGGESPAARRTGRRTPERAARMVEIQREIKRERNLPASRDQLSPEKYQYIRRLATRRETDEFTRQQRAAAAQRPAAPAAAPAAPVSPAPRPAPAPAPQRPPSPSIPTAPVVDAASFPRTAAYIRRVSEAARAGDIDAVKAVPRFMGMSTRSRNARAWHENVIAAMRESQPSRPAAQVQQPAPTPQAHPAPATPNPAQLEDKAALAAKEARLASEKERLVAYSTSRRSEIIAQHSPQIAEARSAEQAALAAAESARRALEQARARRVGAETSQNTALAAASRDAERAVNQARERLSQVRSRKQELAIGKHNTTLKDKDGKVIYSPETFKPKAEPGRNVRATTSPTDFVASVRRMNDSGVERTAKIFNATIPPGASIEQKSNILRDAMVKSAHTMIADLPGKWTVSVDPNNNSVSFMSDDGTDITRTFSITNGKKEVYHAYFANGGRGGDESKTFFRNSIGVYDALGIETIKVTANIDRGGYVWGRYGFVPATTQCLQSLQRVARAGLDKLKTSGSYNQMAYNAKKNERLVPGAKISAEKHAELMAYANSTNPRDMFKLFDAREGNVKIGAELFMGRQTFWSGVLNTKTRDYDRFKAYAASGK